MPTSPDVPTVLLVEDEAGVCTVARLGLEAAGYSVMEAADGAAAIEAAEHHPGPIHLLLTDVHLCGMSGVEVARRVRVRHPDVRVLFTSGDAAGPAGLDFPSAFLPKPFNLAALAAKVRNALGR
jgi:two-component system cell cycle sensor histidine kinase/response regulator CckA